jgi:ubiquinone/menaquinone biosynthesis C-methylase UbiE
MAGMHTSYLTLSDLTYAGTISTILQKKGIPSDVTIKAIIKNIPVSFYILPRALEWFCIALFSLFLIEYNNFITIILFVMLTICIEMLINSIGIKGLSSLDSTTKTLSKHYNAIDGNADEKAYNSDVCVQRYFQRRKTAAIKKLLRASDGEIILDIGCGSGVQIMALNVNSPKFLIGTDISLDALIYAKNKNITGSEFVRCDAQHLPFKSHSIDKIICAEVIEHLNKPKLMIDETQRILKNNGSIVITTPNEISIWGVYEFMWDMFGRGRNYGETHLRFFSTSDLDEYFKSFKTKSYTLFFISPLVALMSNRTLVKWSKHFDAIFERMKFGVSIIYYAKKE